LVRDLLGENFLRRKDGQQHFSADRSGDFLCFASFGMNDPLSIDRTSFHEQLSPLRANFSAADNQCDLLRLGSSWLIVGFLLERPLATWA